MRRDHKAEITKLLRGLSHSRNVWEVFRDFVAMSALALASCDLTQREAREEAYMAIVRRYSKEDASEMARALAITVQALEAGICDFLGDVFMSMEFGDARKGQFFTPYSVSRLMSDISLGDGPKGEIERSGFVTICDPCIGGGAMIIAAAHSLHDSGVNYQTSMHATGMDIDIVAVHMAFVQLSILGIPAILQHGNSLSLEIWSTWYTPLHILGGWNRKLNRRDHAATEIRIPPGAAPLASKVPPKASTILPVFVPGPAVVPIGAVDQLSLF